MLLPVAEPLPFFTCRSKVCVTQINETPFDIIRLIRKLTLNFEFFSWPHPFALLLSVLVVWIEHTLLFLHLILAFNHFVQFVYNPSTTKLSARSFLVWAGVVSNYITPRLLCFRVRFIHQLSLSAFSCSSLRIDERTSDVTQHLNALATNSLNQMFKCSRVASSVVSKCLIIATQVGLLLHSSIIVTFSYRSALLILHL